MNKEDDVEYEPGSDFEEDPFNPEEFPFEDFPEGFDVGLVPPDIQTWGEFWDWFIEVYDLEGIEIEDYDSGVLAAG